jgi:hypothetical protein
LINRRQNLASYSNASLLLRYYDECHSPSFRATVPERFPTSVISQNWDAGYRKEFPSIDTQNTVLQGEEVAAEHWRL